tara:strand:+ start:561 stop:1040 length:480 start_codon:yes stop_codon:yes gene_type:complete
VDTYRITTRDGQLAPLCRSTRQNNSIEVRPQLRDRQVYANFSIGSKLSAFGFHLGESSIKVLLFHFEFGDSVPKQTSDSVSPFKDNHAMPRSSQLLCCSEPRRPRSDHPNPPTSVFRRNQRSDPPFRPRTVDYRDLDLLDGDWRFIDSQHAGGLAGSGT